METLGYALAAPQLHPLYQQCNAEREQLKHMVQFSEDKAWNILTRVWKKSAALKTTDPLSNYSLYESPECKDILLQILRHAHSRLQREDTRNQSGNILLTGIHGVGKTTILKGAAISTAMLCPNILVVLRNYQAEPPIRLSKHVRELARLRDKSIANDQEFARVEADQLEYVLNKLAVSYDLNVACFGDDIHRLFKPNRIHGDVQVDLIGDYCYIGKHPTSFGIVTGFSQLTERLAFNAKHSSSEYSSYSSLNSTVYHVARVYPIHTKNELKDALSVLFPNLTFSNDALDEIQETTGGVGQLINEYVNGNSNRKIIYEQRRRVLIEEMKHNTNFTCLISTLYAANIDENRSVWNPYKIPTEQVYRNHVTRLELEKWSDSSLIYMGDEYIQFFCYVDFHVLHEFFKERIDYWTQVALSLNLLGWRDKGLACAYAKHFIRNVLVEKNILSKHKICYKYRTLKCSTKTLAVTNDDHQEQAVSFSEIFSELLDVMPYTGIDGVVISQVSSDDNTVTVDVTAIQIKLGECYTKITKGGHFGENDATIRGVFNKARKGFQNLETYLLAVWQDHRVLTARNVVFTLVTSKALNDDARKEAQTPNIKFFDKDVQVAVIEEDEFRTLDDFLEQCFIEYDSIKGNHTKSEK
jgi:hypothetical protein